MLTMGSQVETREFKFVERTHRQDAPPGYGRFRPLFVSIAGGAFPHSREKKSITSLVTVLTSNRAQENKRKEVLLDRGARS